MRSGRMVMAGMIVSGVVMIVMWVVGLGHGLPLDRDESGSIASASQLNGDYRLRRNLMAHTLRSEPEI
jgi:hypothetical protein